LYPFLERRVLSGAAAIVCNSRYLERTLGAAHPDLRRRMTTVYNGIDHERYSSGRAVGIQGVPLGHPTLLSVTTWNLEQKTEGGRLLIDAMGTIIEKHPAARLVVAVLAQHRRYAQAIETYLAERPWRDAVTIVYNRPDVHDLLARAEMFVYASGLDSLPRALLEAHVAGLPIVTTSAAGCAEVVEDGITGFVVDPEPSDIAARVLTLLEDAGMRRRFGARGRQRVRDIFSWDRMADGYAEVLHRALAGASPDGSS
jgi:glycosyltransferase involved in cell wall biosynthesis